MTSAKVGVGWGVWRHTAASGCVSGGWNFSDTETQEQKSCILVHLIQSVHDACVRSLVGEKESCVLYLRRLLNFHIKYSQCALQWSHLGGGGLTCTVPILSCSEVRMRSSTLPDLGNVHSEIHCVNPNVMKESRNFSSVCEGDPHGLWSFQVTEGRLNSPKNSNFLICTTI